jgi:hypothetical protein
VVDEVGRGEKPHHSDASKVPSSSAVCDDSGGGRVEVHSSLAGEIWIDAPPIWFQKAVAKGHDLMM